MKEEEQEEEVDFQSPHLPTNKEDMMCASGTD